MQSAMKYYDDVDSWKTVMFLYNSALKEVGTKLEILNDEFQHVHRYNPIEHIKTRIKSAESIVKKLKRYGYETSIENMVRYVNDRESERLKGSVDQRLYQESEGKWIQELPHAGVRSDLSVGQCGGYEGRDPDQDNCDGFLGESGA